MFSPRVLRHARSPLPTAVVPLMGSSREALVCSIAAVRGRVVLNNFSEEIRECLQHAVDCALQAAAQSDPKIIGALKIFGFLAFMVVL